MFAPVYYRSLFPSFLLLLFTLPDRADTLSGQVISMSGAGIAGVRIDVENLAGPDPTVQNDTTDAFGNFAAIVPAGLYRVILRPPSPPATTFLPGEIESLFVVGVTDMGVITLGTGVTLSGRLVDFSGVPVTNVDLDVVDESLGEDILVLNDNSDPLGLFTVVVPIGPISLQVDPSTVPPGTATLAPREIALTMFSETHMGDIVLQPGFVATGVVLDPIGFPVVNADLDFDDSTTGLSLYTPGDNTDGFGVFSVVVPVGIWDIRICPPPGALLVSKTFENFPLTGDLSTGVLFLEAGVQLSGTVVDCVGVPVQGADIDVRDSFTTIGVSLCNDNTDSSGNYAVVVPTGVFDILFTSNELGTTSQNSDVPVGASTVSNGILPCCPTGSVTVVNGSGANPVALQALTVPTIGAALDLEIDAAGHAPNFVGVFAFSDPLAPLPTPAGELMVHPGSSPLFQLARPHLGGPTSLNGSIPLNSALCGRTIHAQGVILGAPGPRLTNALQISVGG